MRLSDERGIIVEFFVKLCLFLADRGSGRGRRRVDLLRQPPTDDAASAGATACAVDFRAATNSVDQAIERRPGTPRPRRPPRSSVTAVPLGPARPGHARSPRNTAATTLVVGKIGFLKKFAEVGDDREGGGADVLTVAVVTDSAADLSPTPRPIARHPRRAAHGDLRRRDPSWTARTSPPRRSGTASRDRTRRRPTTASPPPEAFARAYREAAEAGARRIVSVHLSGAAVPDPRERPAAAARRRPSRSRWWTRGACPWARAWWRWPPPGRRAEGASHEEVAGAGAGRAGATRAVRDARRRRVPAPRRAPGRREGGRVGPAAYPARPDPGRRERPSSWPGPRTRSRAIAEVLGAASVPGRGGRPSSTPAPRRWPRSRPRVARRPAGSSRCQARIGAAIGAHLGPRAARAWSCRRWAPPKRPSPANRLRPDGGTRPRPSAWPPATCCASASPAGAWPPCGARRTRSWRGQWR